jgi:hypothetical protein
MLHQRRHHGHWAEWSTKAKVGVVTAALLGIPGLFALCGVITMTLWNALMPDLFRLPSIGFWQSLGLLALSHILFKGVGGHAARSHWRKREVWRRMQGEPQANPERA